MKELDFYEEYLFYLDWKLNEGLINKGKYSLFKITKSEYDKFINRLETDEKFNEKFIKLLQTEKRDEKIDIIIQDDDFEEESINHSEIQPIKDSEIDELFNDFDL